MQHVDNSEDATDIVRVDNPKKVNVSASPAEAKSSSTGQRVITALIGIPIVLVVIFFGGWVMFAALILVLICTTYELHGIVRSAGYRPYLWLTFALSLLFVITAMFPQQRFLLLQLGIGIALLISFPLFFIRSPSDRPMTDWGLTLALSFYLGWSQSCLLLLRGSTPVKVGQDIPQGVWWMLLLLLGVWGFDSGAYFVGRAIGRHPVAPKISPGKNWEGLIGGTIVSVTISLLLGVRTLGIPWYLAVVLGMFLGIMAICGDLSESMMKRQANVKDSGVIIPGHGGILDRSDSILFGSVLVYMFSLFIVR